MDTFRQSKYSVTVSLMLGLFVSGSAVLAGPSSVLDPYATIQAPSGKAAKQLLPESTAVETSTTYVNMDGDKQASPIHIKKAFKIGGHTTKPEKQTVAKTKVEKIKTAKAETTKGQTKKSSLTAAKTDDGIVGGTKTKLVDGSKSLGDGLSSGAKASGSFFMKGAKAIGGGFKGSDDDKHPRAPGIPGDDPQPTKATKAAKEKKPKEEKLVAEKKKEDKKKDEKKKDPGVFSPISNMYKGTVYEIKDTLHAATDKLSITKPKAGKDSAAERVAEQAAKSDKKKHDASAQSNEGTYISKGKPVKKPSEGNGLVSKTFGKLPFMGSKKSSDGQELKLSDKSNSDKDSINLDPDNIPRQSASQKPLGAM